MRPKGLTGQEAEDALDRCGIIVNKNAIPFDPLPPAVTSGLRIGTPALTSRGLGTVEIGRVGELIAQVLEAPGDDALAARVRGEVSEICAQHPAPGVPLS